MIQIKLNHDETIISFDGDNGLEFHKGFYDPDISRYFEVNLSSMTGNMEIVFKEIAIARVSEKGFALLRGIHNPLVFNSLKVFEGDVYSNEPWVIVGVDDKDRQYFLCLQDQGLNSWESDIDSEVITLFSKEDAETALQQQEEADIEWFNPISAHPISYFAN
jgi:hypothetical protein